MRVQFVLFVETVPITFSVLPHGPQNLCSITPYCITWFQIQLILTAFLTTCQIRDHSHCGIIVHRTAP